MYAAAQRYIHEHETLFHILCLFFLRSLPYSRQSSNVRTSLTPVQYFLPWIFSPICRLPFGPCSCGHTALSLRKFYWFLHALATKFRSEVLVFWCIHTVAPPQHSCYWKDSESQVCASEWMFILFIRSVFFICYQRHFRDKTSNLHNFSFPMYVYRMHRLRHGPNLLCNMFSYRTLSHRVASCYIKCCYYPTYASLWPIFAVC